jgi:hypothetical protein
MDAWKLCSAIHHDFLPRSCYAFLMQITVTIPDEFAARKAPRPIPPVEQE